MGVYSRPIVPRPVNTDDSHFCNRPIAVPDRPNRPKGERGRRPIANSQWEMANGRINGAQAKGYCQEDMVETVRRYVPKSEARALLEEIKIVPEEATVTGPTNRPPTNGQPLEKTE